MNKVKSLIWVVILATAMACRAAPTAGPATAIPSTAQLATVAAPFTARPGTTAVSTATATAVTVATASSTAPTVTATVTATDTTSPTTPDGVPTVGAGEVVKLSGDTFTTSDPFRFSADATLQITWNYTGTAPFALWLVNASAEVSDPKYDRILITDITGPHSGTAAVGIIAGDWTLQVEQANGPWTVEIKPKS